MLIVAAGIIFSTLYQDEVKAYIVGQINNSVNTKIDVKEVNFSVFKKFPYASLEFKKVTAEDAIKLAEKGTLFSAQSIYLQFNILDVLNKNYTIKKISVENGIINVRINKKGNDNYHFWKEHTKNNNTNFKIALEDLKFKEVTFYFLNEIKDVDMSVEAVQLSLAGNFSENKFTLKTKSNLFVHQINQKGQSLLKDKTIKINTSLAINQKTKIYTIKKGKIALENLSFNLSGDIKNREKGIELNIQSKGTDLAMDDLFSLFPKKQKEFLNSYKTKGNITYSAIIKGIYSISKTPSFTANFSISDGEITEKSSNKALTNIVVSGNYTNGSENSFHSSKLALNKLSAKFGAGKILGNYTITNFAKPYIEFQSKANIDLNMAKYFFKLDTLEFIAGTLNIDLNYKGYIKELSDVKASDLQNLDANGNIHLKKINLKFVNDTRNISINNAAFRFKNNNVNIDSLSLKINQSSIDFQGKFKNLLAFLFVKNQNLAIRAKIHSSKLNLNDFILNSNANKSDSSYKLNLPKNIQFNFISTIDSFRFRKFKATNFKGNFQLYHQVLTATDVYFNAMQGSVTGNIAIDDAKQKNILITSKTKLNSINIYQLFYQFENFGQDYILAKNLKGIANANIDFASVWDKKLTINKDKIYVSAQINVNNGELINYKPMLAMSKFIAVKELEHIKFSELNTTIEIKNQTVFIPKTDIKSSALDLTLAGTHQFNNKIDYHFQLLMNNLLWKKAKKAKKENNEFGYVQDDGLGKTTLFLHMKGTVDDYKISYDTKGLKESWKKDLKKEKHTLKQILNKEFGWFKKDSTLNKNDKPKDDGFIIEWEEDDTQDSLNKDAKSQEVKKGRQKKQKKGLGKFIDKIAQPDDPEYEENTNFFN